MNYLLNYSYNFGTGKDTNNNESQHFYSTVEKKVAWSKRLKTLYIMSTSWKFNSPNQTRSFSNLFHDGTFGESVLYLASNRSCILVQSTLKMLISPKFITIYKEAEASSGCLPVLISFIFTPVTSYYPSSCMCHLCPTDISYCIFTQNG